MSYVDYIGMVPADYTDNELIKINSEIEEEYNELVEQWAEDVKSVSTENFDPYSFWGERKLKKIAKKYADKAAEMTIIMEDIEREFALRENYNEQQKYIGSNTNIPKNNSNLSTDEFIQRESMKTLRHRLENDTESDDEE